MTFLTRSLDFFGKKKSKDMSAPHTISRQQHPGNGGGVSLRSVTQTPAKEETSRHWRARCETTAGNTRCSKSHLKSVQIIDHSRRVHRSPVSARDIKMLRRMQAKQNKRKVASSPDCSAKGSRVEERHAAPPRQSRDWTIYAALLGQEQKASRNTLAHLQTFSSIHSDVCWWDGLLHLGKLFQSLSHWHVNDVFADSVWEVCQDDKFFQELRHLKHW